MSWDVRLVDSETRRSLPVARHVSGGTYPIGGTTSAELNVTYNYSGRFLDAWPEVLDARPGDGTLGKMLDGRTGGETEPLLRVAVAALGGDDPDRSYWNASAGNAAHALQILLGWAREHPAGVWEVS